MRKAILWVLIALMALQGVAFATEILPAEAKAAPANTAAANFANGMDAARTAAEIYLILPSGEGEMLVRLPLDGGLPVCMDRADSIEGLMNYGAGAAYLKTTGGSSAIMSCEGNNVTTLYSFGMASAQDLAAFDGKLLVLMNGLLHSIDPATGVCLKLSGAQMLEYVVGDGYAYYLSGGDQMEYTAQLEGDETASAQAGCIYRLDLNSGETDLLLKSGGEDLEILEQQLYFHNLADAYAVRTADAAILRGRVYSLNSQMKTLEQECAQPDSGYWPTRSGVVAWYDGALNLGGEAGAVNLYAPENGSIVTFDGEALYVWEPSKQTLTEVRPNGTQTLLYTGDLTQATSAALLPTATATPEPSATPGTDLAADANNDWFTNFINNKDLANGGGSTSNYPQATPIGATPTPLPTATPRPVVPQNPTTNPGGGSSSGSSSSGQSVYSVNIDYLKVSASVNMRSQAGTGNSVKAVIPSGAVVDCLGKACKTSSGAVWYKVEYKGMTGWIYSKYAKKTSAPSESDSSSITNISGKYVKAVGGDVNIRSTPSRSGKIVGAMGSGKYATCLGKAAKDSRGVVWYKVKYNGVTGWVSSRYSKVTNSTSSGGSDSSKDSVKIVGGDVTIRSKADKSSAKLGVILEGKTASYLGKTSVDSRGVQWYKVKYNGITGWVSSMYARLV